MLPTYSKTEQALHESAEQYRLLVEGVKDYAIFILDTEGYIKTWNEGARRLKGYNADQIIGKHFTQFYLEEDIRAGKPQWELEQALTIGKIEDEGWRLRKDGTKFWANVVVTRINDKAGRHIGFSKVTRDLTERKQIEETLRKINQDLDRRVKERTLELEKAVQARDQFVSMASHELKTPLTSLKLQAQIMQRLVKKGDPSLFTHEQLSQFADQLNVQVDRLSHLVEDMLDISRIRLGKLTAQFEKTNLYDIVLGALDRYHLHLKNAQCEVTLKLQDVVDGYWDRYRLEQVVLNLLSNACKYGLGNPITISSSQVGDRAILCVADQGMGISKEFHDRIFERYMRATSPSEISGLGLGLYISSEIVKAHEGTIRVESELGKGSKFFVELPLHPHTVISEKRTQEYDF